MLSARLDGETILLHEPRWESQEALLRAASREGRLTAPCCGAQLILKWGQRKVRHCAHAPRTDCPYERWSEPESPEHMAGKVLLFNWCQRHFGAAARLIALEHPLPATQQRPDLYVELHDGTRYAIEYQRSVITPGEWTERRNGYQRQGIHDIWIFGENRHEDALPSEEQQARWSGREPHMHFLRLRAFEGEAAVWTPYEVAWWRGDHQEELWGTLEIDVRVGREVNPWYERSALKRLRSVAFLDSRSGAMTIYRAMRELPGHTDVRMASVRHDTHLDDSELDLEQTGFFLPKDRQRLEQHLQRIRRLEAAASHQVQREENPPPQPVPAESSPLPAHFPAYYQSLALDRASRRWPAEVDGRLFQPGEQEEEQRRRLASRAANPQWRKLVDRYGLTPERLHYLVGIPIPDDTCITVHRTVWQGFIYYALIHARERSLTTRGVLQLVERLFGLDQAMERASRYWLLGQVNTAEEVIGQFLLLLVDAGYLRNDRRASHLRFYPPDLPAPHLAFQERSERWRAWAGLLQGTLRRNGYRLVGEGDPIPLVEAELADHPTVAQVEAVARIASRSGLTMDLERLTFSEASRILSDRRRERHV